MAMKIKDISQSLNIEFKYICIEGVFKYDNRVFMKISNKEEDNCYDFNKHRLTSITEDTIVEFVQSELILHHREWKE